MREVWNKIKWFFLSPTFSPKHPMCERIVSGTRQFSDLYESKLGNGAQVGRGRGGGGGREREGGPCNLLHLSWLLLVACHLSQWTDTAMWTSSFSRRLKNSSIQKLFICSICSFLYFFFFFLVSQYFSPLFSYFIAVKMGRELMVVCTVLWLFPACQTDAWSSLLEWQAKVLVVPGQPWM